MATRKLKRSYADRNQGRKKQFKVFTNVASVRIEMQALHNKYMNGEIDDKVMQQARCNMQLMVELVSREFLEKDVDDLKELIKQTRANLPMMGGYNR